MTQNFLAQKGALVAALAVLAFPAASQAADARRAEELQAVVDCRAVADNVARLACYDSAAARLDEAEAKGDVVVLDKAQRQQARREAFGFNLPSIDIFSRDGAEKMDRESFKVVRAWENNGGQVSVELETGAVWRQTDQELLSRRPKPGSTVEIRSAAMGSYLMNVDGQRAIRVTRER
ncbi:MAG TPA: hypothetical protein VF138_10945 [Caulobacteraceae bacterium]